MRATWMQAMGTWQSFAIAEAGSENLKAWQELSPEARKESWKAAWKHMNRANRRATGVRSDGRFSPAAATKASSLKLKWEKK